MELSKCIFNEYFNYYNLFNSCKLTLHFHELIGIWFVRDAILSEHVGEPLFHCTSHLFTYSPQTKNKRSGACSKTPKPYHPKNYKDRE